MAVPNEVHQTDLLFLPHDPVRQKSFRYALAVVDVASRYKEAEPLTSKTASEVADNLARIYKRSPLRGRGSFRLTPVVSSWALLTRSYTQHALRPVIDSKINHIRHFIKIPFINKGMDFIDLPSIFRDKSAQSSIPNYFKNYEVPIICYKYNKPIRGAIFNFNKLVSDLDIETCNPDS